MRKSNLRAVALLCGVSTCLVAAPVRTEPLLELRFELPRAGSNLNVELPANWPLVIRGQAQQPVDVFALDEYRTELLVLATDPNKCMDQYAWHGDFDLLETCLQNSPETMYTLIRIDEDHRGVVDGTGFNDLGSLLTDSTDNGPVFQGKKLLPPIRLGIETGGDVLDGFGYGANDDWPGLVLLTNAGVGLVLDPSFNPPRRSTRRNLAGLLTWTGFELLDADRRTAISTGTMVPSGLFLPLTMLDQAVGPPSVDPLGGYYYTEPTRYRVDGGPMLEGASACSFNASSMDSGQYELRAFVVRGSAPAQLTDMDRDGDVDSRDASLTGFDVISNEARLQFRQWSDGGTYVDAPDQIIFRVDLDRNGAVTNDCDDNDIGPGRIKTPPQ